MDDKLYYRELECYGSATEALEEQVRFYTVWRLHASTYNAFL